ncbi:MAG: glutamate--tRNA ligase family protein [Planctomycetota bacterium]
MTPGNPTSTTTPAPASADSGGVVTRFAPSPTGALHVGGVRTALFAWAFAKRHGGTFHLRLEDTDAARSSDASAESILQDLAWVGLDHTPWFGPGAEDDGPFAGIPRQSERHALGVYDPLFEKLIAADLAYEDDGALRLRMGKPVTVEDAVFGMVSFEGEQLEDFVIRKGDAGGRMPTFHFAVVVDDAAMGVTHVLRGQEHLNNTPKHAAIYDALAQVTGDAQAYRRPVWAHMPSIMNPDGSKMSKRDKAKAARAMTKEPGFDLAEAVGRVSASLLGGPEPVAEREDVLTAAGVVGPGGGLNAASLEAGVEGAFARLMDKSEDNAVFAALALKGVGRTAPEIETFDFRRSGYLPTVLCNYLALLGWSPGDGEERFGGDPLGYIAARFDLGRIGKANAKFDRDKLLKFNTESVVEMPPEAFLRAIRDEGFAPEGKSVWRRWVDADGRDAETLWSWLASATQERSKTLADPFAQAVWLSEDDAAVAGRVDPGSKPIKKAMFKGQAHGIDVLERFHVKLQAEVEAGGLADWTPEPIRAFVEGFVEQETFGDDAAKLKNMGGIAQPLRVALTGTTVSPPIDLTLALSGREMTLRRIARCVAEMRAAAPSGAAQGAGSS